ncbi:MAG: hypothetical protein E5299_01423 [Burkholderia gladioli]|nr:MAG: hypothetical protein E5299_01423 [Burkholderia gladioli]
MRYEKRFFNFKITNFKSISTGICSKNVEEVDAAFVAFQDQYNRA